MPFKCTLSRPTALAKAPQPCLNSCSAEPAKARARGAVDEIQTTDRNGVSDK
jgi:hypothetical protein